jgi:hypothetical protein
MQPQPALGDRLVEAGLGTGSIVLAISTSLRAAISGSAKGRGRRTSFVRQHGETAAN